MALQHRAQWARVWGLAPATLLFALSCGAATAANQEGGTNDGERPIPASHPYAFAVEAPQGAGKSSPADEIDCFVEDKRIEIPGLSGRQVAYNPSIVPYGSGAIMAFRLDDKAHIVDMRVGFVALDANFEVASPVSILDLRPPGQPLHSAEDPRLVWHLGQLFLVVNQRTDSLHYYPRNMYLARIDGTYRADVAKRGHGAASGGTYRTEAADGTPAEGTFRAWTTQAEDPSWPDAEVHDLGADEAGQLHFVVGRLYRMQPPEAYPRRHVEKNWTPFSDGNAFHLIYRTSPPEVLTVPEAMLADTPFDIVPTGPELGGTGLSYDHGEVRGGSGAAPLDGNGLFEAFFHAQRLEGPGPRYKAHYTIGFYLFEGAAPYAIRAFLPAPIWVPDLHATDDRYLSCSYPGGFIRRGPYYYLAYGRQDRAVHVMTLDANALWSQLVEP